MLAMGLGRPSDAPVVTGRVGRWHLTLMEIPSAGADPVTSVHKNLFAVTAAGRGRLRIRALSDLCVGNSIGLSRDRSGLSRRFILPPRKPRHARGSFLLIGRRKPRPA